MGSRYFSCLFHEEVGKDRIVSPQWGLLRRSIEGGLPSGLGG